MAVKKIGEKYRCNVCGNEVIVSKVGAGELVCCGKSMEKIEG
jgi:desulfoferrodoxin-like iron-binding protein